jgi:hypothetical protein
MTNHSRSSPSSLCDVCLLLRSHAEQSWLTHEMVPLLRELEHPDSLPEDQLGAALAYLEVLWVEASQRAAETEAAKDDLNAIDLAGVRSLSNLARGYHAAVCTLRNSVAQEVAQLLAAPGESGTHDPARTQRDRRRAPTRSATSGPIGATLRDRRTPKTTGRS